MIESDVDKQTAEDYYMFYYADFLNRLTSFKYIPQTTVTDIAEEYLANTKKSLKQREILLRNSLKSIPNISQNDVEKIVLDVLGNDNFLKAQIALNSEYKRTKFVQENMNYVGPDEIVLNEEEIKQGKKKDVLHFIKISESVKTLLEDPSLNKMMALSSASRSSEAKIRDLKDGSSYKENLFFVNNPDAYSILLYSDAVELKVGFILKLIYRKIQSVYPKKIGFF